MHIGLIGGIGPAATEFYYRGLVKAHNTIKQKMNLTIAHADTFEMVNNMENNKAQLQAEIFAQYVNQLKAGGAEAVAVTSLGGHFCIEELISISALPIINAIPALNDHFAKKDIEKIGLLGTQAVMTTKLYGGISSAEVTTPPEDEIENVHRQYIAMATSGAATDQQRSYFHAEGQKLCRDQGADAVALAGTDLFLAFGKRDHGYPIVDCAQVHIEAITNVSINGL